MEDLHLEHAVEVTATAIAEEKVFRPTKVTFGAGVSVKSVLIACVPCMVLVENLPLTATKAEVATLFTRSGSDPTKFTVHLPPASPGDKFYPETAVEFKGSVDGKNAGAGLDGIEFGSEKLKLVIAP